MVSPTFLFGRLPASQKHSSSTAADDNDHPFKKSRTGDVVPGKDPSLPTGGEWFVFLMVLLAQLMSFLAIIRLITAMSSFMSCITFVYYVRLLSVSVSDRTNVLASLISDFASLARVGAFVDKSPALQDFLREHGPIHLLLHPRRSGKTTLLRMFR
jgi:ABC-type multidrug transport system fused ATPase/permease subunit